MSASELLRNCSGADNLKNLVQFLWEKILKKILEFLRKIVKTFFSCRRKSLRKNRLKPSLSSFDKEIITLFCEKRRLMSRLLSPNFFIFEFIFRKENYNRYTRIHKALFYSTEHFFSKFTHFYCSRSSLIGKKNLSLSFYFYISLKFSSRHISY